MQKKSKTKIRPLQKQNKPGLEAKLSPLPEIEPIQQNGKLKGKTAIIIGGTMLSTGLIGAKKA